MKYMAVRYPEKINNYSLEKRAELLDEFNARQTLHGKTIHHTDPSMPYSHLQVIPGGGDAEQASIAKFPAYYDPDQLYDLSKDPYEQKNLIDDPVYQESLLDLQNELRQYLLSLPGYFAELK
jgi:hypothetical protein